MSAYPHLFSPLRIGSVTVRNRIMQTAHVKLFAHDAVDSQRNVDYQAARAKGGAGLLITGNRVVHPTSTTGFPRVAWAYLPEALEADRRLTDAVHEHGAVIFAQLNHFGLNASSDSADDLRVLWGPSAVKSPAYGETPKAMEHEDIREVVEWWGRSAELSREGGFDGTEVHISHSYLLHQFLSPLYNKRTDEYGGSFENRLRFAREVIDEVRGRVGADWVVGVRISLTDFVPGALDIDDAIRVAQELERAGGLDYVNVTAAGYHNIWRAIEPSDVPDGYLVDLTAQVKAAVSLPVFAVGGIKDAALAEEILAAGKADMVAMTRAQIADPEFANKAREGREDEIVHCIRGNQGCIGRVFKGLPIACTVNPAAGREGRFGGPLPPADPPARWLVAGGGPAGLKAAATLAERGHEVTLVERAEQLGGQVNLILRTPGREEFRWLVTDLERAAGPTSESTSGSAPRRHRPWSASSPRTASSSRPAPSPSRTGFSSVNPLVDTLPGVDQDNVLTGWDVLLERAPRRPARGRARRRRHPGGRGRLRGAPRPRQRGRARQPLERPLPDHVDHARHGAPLLAAARQGPRLPAERVGERDRGRPGFPLQPLHGRPEAIEGVDTVVLAAGAKANDELYLALKGQVENVHRIGDCVAPRKLDHAIYEGYLAGRELWSAEERYIYEGELERWEEATVGSLT